MLIDNIGDLLIPFLGEILDCLVLIITNTLDSDTKVEACKCLPYVVKKLDKNNPKNHEIIKFLIKKLWDLKEKETDCEVLSEYAFVIKELTV